MSFAFGDIFASSPNPYMVLDREFRYLALNPAYEQVAGRPREELIGRGLFEMFPGGENEDGSAQADILRASLERVLATGERDVLALIPYSMPSDAPDGAAEVRYWSATHTPLKDAEGRVTAILQHTTDVTELHRLREAVHAARGGATSAQLEEGVFSRAAALQRDNARLSAQQRFLTDMFQQAPGFIAVLRGPEHVFELANAAYEQLVDRRDFVGERLRDALPEIAGQGFIELLDQVRETGRAFVGRGLPVLLGPEGAPRQLHVDFVYQPIRDAAGDVEGIFVQGSDVTERETALAAARESEAQFRTMTNVVPQMVWSTGADGAPDYFNQRWFEYTGMAATPRPGEVWTLLHPDDRDAVVARWRDCLRDGEPFEAEYRLRDRDGEYHWVLARALPLRNDAGEPVRWIGTCTEIQEQVRVRDMLERGHRALEEADRQKDRFLAVLAHELRNPLAPIATAAQLLKLAPARVETVVQAAEIIERQSQHMRNLVEDLVDASRIRRGRIALNRQPLQLAQVVAAAIEQTVPLIERRRHRLHVDDAVGDAMLDGDRTRLVQVIANLLNNAARYTPEGGEIHLDTRIEDGSALLRVRDTGIGIDTALLPRVFELFTQAETADVREGGLGIGLALARSLARLHGGELTAHSDGHGCGAMFELRLPLRTAAEADAASADSAAR
ncbi:MAG TPA: PAS domain-containing protein [Lysobacter sp.]|nr:PAS domain-containing protein [Lysobacter sp.]